MTVLTANHAELSLGIIYSMCILYKKLIKTTVKNAIQVRSIDTQIILALSKLYLCCFTALRTSGFEMLVQSG
jgi:hypothetical protein